VLVECHNAEQRELTLHIGSLQCALDKPTLPEKVSLAVRESVHIMDIGEDLPIPEDLMLESVKTDPWRQTVQSHLTWKKQVLEDITRTLEEIHQDTVIGFYIQELITSADHPHPWDGENQISANPDVSVEITVVPQLQIPE
jgi:hypothetical protein